MVLRLLRGEGLDALARETGQAAGTISGWREDFLAAGREGLKSRAVAVEDRRLAEAQRKIGEVSMENDILLGLIEETDRRQQLAVGHRADRPGSPAHRQSSGLRGAASAAALTRRRPGDPGDAAHARHRGLQPLCDVQRLGR